MGLLVGDIGTANEQITITRPDGSGDRVTSGHKPEYGVGGFEAYAQAAGAYKVQFMGQSFDLSLTGQYTKVTFQQVAGADSVRVNFNFRDGRNTYAVGERVFASIEVTNITSDRILFGILGLLTSAGQFQTSWSDGSIGPGETFRHEDGIAFDAAGNHKLQLSICFARKDACTSGQAEDSWVRFEPGLDVVVQ